MESLRLHNQILSSGERFSTLVDESGAPLLFALLYTLSDRHHGGIERIRSHLRRIRDLYQGFAGIGEDLDQILLHGTLEPRDVESVLFYLEDEIETVVQPVGVEGGSPENSGTSRWLRDQRISAWSSFLVWAMDTSNWSLRSASQNPSQRAEAERLKILLEDHRVGGAGRGQVYPFSLREIQVIEEVLGPGEDGDYALSPFKGEAARRMWLLYLLTRWGGMRVGEALKIRLQDLPDRESEAERIIREVSGGALAVELRRLVDDPADGRSNEPHVKRNGRRVPLPDAVVRMLWRCAESLPDTTPYLFRTSDLQSELSYSRATKLCYEARPALSARYAACYPGDPHSLNGFRWHRLRHTRAVEMLPVYFPEGVETDQRKQSFLAAFGWKQMSSAEPYLAVLHRGEGEAIWTRSLALMER